MNYSNVPQKAGMSKARSIIAVDFYNNKTYNFDSVQEAARKLEYDPSSICKVLKGKNKYHKHYYFYYNES